MGGGGRGQRFGTTVGMLLSVNADIAPPGDMVAAGEELCIVASSCAAGLA